MDTNDAVAYLEEVKEALSEIHRETSDLNDRRQSAELLVSNVLKQYSEQPIPLLTDPNCSRIFELLFTEANFDSLVSFLSTVKQQLFVLCSNPFGSHVCEHLLTAIFQKAQTRRDQSDLDTILSQFCEQINSAMSDFLLDRFATHIVRYLIGALSGVDVTSIVKAPTHKQIGVTNIQLNSVPKIDVMAYSRNALFGKLAGAVCKVLEEDSDQTKQLVYNPVSSPTLQALLVALSVLDVKRLISCICLILRCSNQSKLDFEDAHVKRLLQGKISSHFMEVSFRVMPEDLLNRLFQDCIRPNLLQMSLHPSANFPIQTALSRIQKPDMLKSSIHNLGPHFDQILIKKRTGVLVSLFVRALECGTEKFELCGYLFEALKKMKTSSYQHSSICEILLCHGTASQLGVDFQKLSHKGCILLETVLHYPKDYIEPFLVSIKSMNEKGIEHIATDSCGARILEQLFSNEEIPKQMKKSVLSKLKDRWTQLAMSSSGSHLLEACFNFAKPEMRDQIMQNLELNKQEICQSTWGSAAFSRCQEMQSSVQTTQSNKNKREVVGHGDTKSRKRSKKKKIKSQKAVFCAPTYL